MVGGCVSTTVTVNVQVDPPPAAAEVPRIWKMLSGAAVGTQVVLRPQLGVQPAAKPPPGLIQAAPELDVTVRSNQPHSPLGVKFMLACTETQCVPAMRVAALGKAMLKLPATSETGT